MIAEKCSYVLKLYKLNTIDKIMSTYAIPMTMPTTTRETHSNKAWQNQQSSHRVVKERYEGDGSSEKYSNILF